MKRMEFRWKNKYSNEKLDNNANQIITLENKTTQLINVVGLYERKVGVPEVTLDSHSHINNSSTMLLSVISTNSFVLQATGGGIISLACHKYPIWSEWIFVHTSQEKQNKCLLKTFIQQMFIR